MRVFSVHTSIHFCYNLLCYVILCPFILPAQNGPGGVGANDGTSSLTLWLDANQGVYSDLGTTLATNGDGVQQWQDQSGNGFHAIQNSSDARPAYTEGTINSLSFATSTVNAEVDFLDLTANVGSIIDKTQSFYFVASRTGVNADFIMYACNSGGVVQSASRYNGLGSSSNVLEYHVGFANSGGTQVFMQDGTNTNNTNIIGAVSNDTRILYNVWNTGSEVFVSSNNDNGVSDASPNGNNQPASTLFIGRHASDNSNLNRGFDGDISEMIVFNNIVNDAQNIIIHNYLAAKYGITLSDDDIYDEDDHGFIHEVAGIGRTDASNIHNDAQSGIARISNPSDLGDNEFLIFGHNNGVAEGTQKIDVPIGVEARLNRVWRVSEVDTTGAGVYVGSVDIQFDLSGLGGVVAADLVLLIDSDNDGSFGDETAISGATDNGGNVYQFSAVSGIQNNFRFTVGTADTLQTPLPIALVNFYARRLSTSEVQVEWTTSSELNCRNFEVQKSSNQISWSSIDFKDCNDFSNQTNSYSFIDNEAIQDVLFYRLKQTDNDGTSELYPAVSVVNHSSKLVDNINIYPNPAQNRVIIDAEKEIRLFEVTDTRGMPISVSYVKLATNRYEVSISNLLSGVYFFRINKINRKLIKL